MVHPRSKRRCAASAMTTVTSVRHFRLVTVPSSERPRSRPPFERCPPSPLALDADDRSMGASLDAILADLNSPFVVRSLAPASAGPPTGDTIFLSVGLLTGPHEQVHTILASSLPDDISRLWTGVVNKVVQPPSEPSADRTLLLVRRFGMKWRM